MLLLILSELPLRLCHLRLSASQRPRSGKVSRHWQRLLAAESAAALAKGLEMEQRPASTVSETASRPAKAHTASQAGPWQSNRPGTETFRAGIRESLHPRYRCGCRLDQQIPPR